MMPDQIARLIALALVMLLRGIVTGVLVAYLWWLCWPTELIRLVRKKLRRMWFLCTRPGDAVRPESFPVVWRSSREPGWVRQLLRRLFR